MTDDELKIKSIHYRKKLLKYIKKANAGHTGGSLSCVDILNVLYNRILNVSPENFNDPRRDRYIQSKGHSVEAIDTWNMKIDAVSTAKPGEFSITAPVADYLFRITAIKKD